MGMSMGAQDRLKPPVGIDPSRSPWVQPPADPGLRAMIGKMRRARIVTHVIRCRNKCRNKKAHARPFQAGSWAYSNQPKTRLLTAYQRPRPPPPPPPPPPA